MNTAKTCEFFLHGEHTPRICWLAKLGNLLAVHVAPILINTITYIIIFEVHLYLGTPHLADQTPIIKHQNVHVFISATGSATQ